MGAGNDAVVCATRQPEDSKRVTVVGGAYGNPLPEHLFVPVMLSYAKEPVIDVIENATLETVYGHPIRLTRPGKSSAVGGKRNYPLR